MGRAPSCDKNGLKKGPWTPEEDQKLIDYIQKHGYGNWRTLPKNAGLQRCGKSCRLRWSNYLRPDIKRGRFSFEEEEAIIQLHCILGNKWSAIAARLPGRTDNEIKNYWNTHIRKRLLGMGIDPVTHRPRLDLLDLSSLLNTVYNPNQMNNMSKLLGLQQTQVNSELLRLTTCLMSSQKRSNTNNQSFFQYQNQLRNSQTSQLNNTTHNYVPFPNQAQLNSELSSLRNLSSSISQMTTDHNHQLQNRGMSSCFSEDVYVPNLPSYDCFVSDNQTVKENRNQNFSFMTSVLSTPTSSSLTHLNSNSTTCFNSSSNEDELESYCSNMLNFEIPVDLLDFAQIM